MSILHFASQLCPFNITIVGEFVFGRTEELPPRFNSCSFMLITILVHLIMSSLTCFTSPGSKHRMKSPRRIRGYAEKEFEEFSVSGKSPFSIQNENVSVADEELLLDVPSNASFPQAELLPSSTSSSSNLVRPWCLLATYIQPFFCIHFDRVLFLVLPPFLTWNMVLMGYERDGWILLALSLYRLTKRLSYVASSRKEEICLVFLLLR